MKEHKFRVGQVVDFHPSPKIAFPAAAQEYKILRLVPHERGERLYRIKTITERFERIAKESELVLGTSASAEGTDVDNIKS